MPERTRRSSKTTTDRGGITTTRRTSDIIQLIRRDHRTVKDLFKQFESSPSRDLFKQIETELQVHTTKEEQIVYPTLKGVDEDFFYEAGCEHHVVDMIMADVAEITDDHKFEAMVTVLMENVLHHIKEEETEGFKLLRKCPTDQRKQMAEAWQRDVGAWGIAARTQERAA